jgi:hypothetical protein
LSSLLSSLAPCFGVTDCQCMCSTAVIAVVELRSMKVHGGWHPVVTRGEVQLHTLARLGRECLCFCYRHKNNV